MTTVIRRLIPILILAALGLAGIGYILINQRFPIPFRDVYEVQAVLPAADGVAPGFGQPVNVSGVKVGTITKAKIADRQAHLTFEIDAKKLPKVYRDARADLRPVTPLSDMRVELTPGTPGSKPMPADGVISADHTTSPVPISTLLTTLDSDTRDFLSTLLAGLARGTRGRAPDLRRILLSFGPTVGQLREVSEALASRRTELSRLVTNVTAVTKAANSDGRLADLVVSGDRTLKALAKQDEPLRRALAEFPGALGTADGALKATADLADQLRPTIRVLTPRVKRLPATLKTVEPVASDFATLLRTQFRPLTAEAQTLAKQAAPAIRATSKVLPDATLATQRLQYLLNEAAYNPPGQQEGTLFWGAWAAHNFNAISSTGDAHGNVLRVLLNVNCTQLNAAGEIGLLTKILTGSANTCPVTDNTAITGRSKTAPVTGSSTLLAPPTSGAGTTKGGK